DRCAVCATQPDAAAPVSRCRRPDDSTRGLGRRRSSGDWLMARGAGRRPGGATRVRCAQGPALDRPPFQRGGRVPLTAASRPHDRSVLQRQYTRGARRGPRPDREQKPVRQDLPGPGTPIIGIAGWKKSGKTTLAVRLIEEFTRRGLKVASVKHAHHAFQVDDGQTDSARHRRAGAQQVAIVSKRRWAVINELGGAPEPNFEEVIAWLEPCDLIVVEGYKSAPVPKIEARRLQSMTKRPLA